MALKHKFITASRNKIFLAGLIIRLLLILLFFPEIQQQWFVPFVVNFIEAPSVNPWQNFLQYSSELNAFPYGPIMLLSHLPFVFIGWLANFIFSSEIFTLIGFKVSLLFADVMLLFILVKMFSNNYREVLLYYWLSPIVIYVTYVHGQTDIVPVSLFFASLIFLKQENIKNSAIAIGLAISAKFSMMIALPFLYLYIIKNKKYKQFLPRYISWSVGVIIISHIIFLFDPGFLKMVLLNEQIQRIYHANFFIGENIQLFIVPLILLLIVHLTWRQSRINFDLLIAMISIAFFAIILTNVSPPGWYIWLAPLFVSHQIKHGKTAVILVAAFSLLLVLFYLLTTSNGWLFPSHYNFETLRAQLLALVSNKYMSLYFTLLFGTGVIIVIQMIRSGIRGNDYFHLTDHNLSVGISGALGSGKDVLNESLRSLFGNHSVSCLSGSNYYKWDRHSPLWKTITPLNPRSNLLMEYTNDGLELIRKRDITGRIYDKNTGFFSKLNKIKSNDIILISGPHALYSEPLRNKLDLKIFLDIDDDLRKQIIRNQTSPLHGLGNKENINDYLLRCEDDIDKYITHQRKYADIMFNLEPLNPDTVSNIENALPPLRLTVTIQHGIYYADLQRVFIGLCNLQTNLRLTDAMGTAVLEIEGESDFKGEDAELAIQMICPNITEILDVSPAWHDGIPGIMQVVILTGINQILQERK